MDFEVGGGYHQSMEDHASKMKGQIARFGAASQVQYLVNYVTSEKREFTPHVLGPYIHIRFFIRSSIHCRKNFQGLAPFHRV